MSTIRQELAASYATALISTVLVIALATWISGTLASNRRVDLMYARQAMLAARADTVLGHVHTVIDREPETQLTEFGPPLRIVSTGDSAGAGQFSGAGDSTGVLNQNLRFLIEQKRGSLPDSLQEYLAVFSRNGNPLHVSSQFRIILQAFTPDSAIHMLEAIGRLPLGPGIARMEIAGRRFLFVPRREPRGSLPISHVVVGTEEPVQSLDSSQTALIILIISPLVIVLSIQVGNSIAGRSLQPVDQIINEVRAISDGRSLHRRLAVDHSSVELARLASTINEMMGRLEKSFTALRTFTADASHELNTPLAVLRADVERAMSPNVAEHDRLVALDEALREVRRMGDLVASLLTLARADEGRFDLHRVQVDLGEMVTDVYETAALLAEDAGQTVKLTILEPAVVEGDPDRLRQLFMNLVSNAIKYTPAGGRIELSLSRRLDGIAFSVKDTGIGIAASDLPHIFERFWRADHSRSRGGDRSGFGLGLPIGSWIAHAHGGTLTATSKLGKGSVFTVTLPLPHDQSDSSATMARFEVAGLEETED